MTPIKTPGLLWDAKPVILGSLYDRTQPSSANARFNMPGFSNAVYVGASGTVVFVLSDGITTLTMVGMAAGIWIGMPPFIHVNPSGAGTTATSIVIGITNG